MTNNFNFSEKISANSIELLGTGTSTGVPVIGCGCDVCQSRNQKDNRMRTSALWRVGNTVILIDAGPDMRTQLIRAGVRSVDAILITHYHYDHVGGLDDTRGICYGTHKPMQIFAEERVAEAMRTALPYVFAVVDKYPGAPELDMRVITPEQDFTVGSGVSVTPIRVMHGKLPIVGFRIGDKAYITDASRIDDAELEKLRGLDALVVNALRIEPHPSHFSLGETLGVIEALRPKRAYLTHISHDMGLHRDVQNTLPPNVFMGYDGLTIY